MQFGMHMACIWHTACCRPTLLAAAAAAGSKLQSHLVKGEVIGDDLQGDTCAAILRLHLFQLKLLLEQALQGCSAS